jgi:hypothetical protein
MNERLVGVHVVRYTRVQPRRYRFSETACEYENDMLYKASKTFG